MTKDTLEKRQMTIRAAARLINKLADMMTRCPFTEEDERIYQIIYTSLMTLLESDPQDNGLESQLNALGFPGRSAN